MARAPSIYRPGTPGGVGGTSGLPAALGRLSGTLDRGRERRDEKRRNLLYYQAADAFQGAYNDALVSGELDELDAQQLQERTNEWIETYGAPLADEPDLREKWEAGQRAKTGDLLAAKVEERKRERQAELQGTLVSVRDEARANISDALRIAASPDTPPAVRAAKFEAVQAYHAELELAYEGLKPEVRAVQAAEDDRWMREEQFAAVVSRHAQEGTLLDFVGRLKNNTDWVDEEAKSGPRWSQGLDTGTRQSILDDGWGEMTRMARADEASRSNRLESARSYRKRVGEGIIDQVVTGELSLEDGRIMMEEQGWSTEALDRAFVSASEARAEADELVKSGDPWVRTLVDDSHVMLRTQDAGAVAVAVSNMRTMMRNGVVTQEQFKEFKAAAEDRTSVLEARTGREREMLRASDGYKQAFLAESGIYVGLTMDAISAEIEHGKDIVQEHRAMAIQIAAEVEEWLIREEATEDVARDAWLMARSLLKVGQMDMPGILSEEERGVVSEAQPEADERTPFWARPFKWWVDDGDDDVPEAETLPPKKRLSPVSAPRIGSGLVTALNRLTEAGHPVDTHREFFGLMPIGEKKLYLRYDEAGALDAGATLDVMDASPELTTEEAAVLYLEVIGPLAALAETTRGWRSGTARAKQQAEWMRAKGLSPQMTAEMSP